MTSGEREVEYNVFILINNKKDTAKVRFNLSRPCVLNFLYNDKIFSCVGDDYFDCFCKIRKELDGIIFYCKGAKVSVYPSRMMRDMGLGLKAYDHKTGMLITKEDEVNIFDYEELNITADPEEQSLYWNNWLNSVR